jgi:hypothetical protein
MRWSGNTVEQPGTNLCDSVHNHYTRHAASTGFLPKGDILKALPRRSRMKVLFTSAFPLRDEHAAE